MEISERNLLGKSAYLALFFGVRFANLSPMKIKIRFPFRLRLSKYWCTRDKNPSDIWQALTIFQ